MVKKYIDNRTGNMIYAMQYNFPCSSKLIDWLGIDEYSESCETLYRNENNENNENNKSQIIRMHFHIKGQSHRNYPYRTINHGDYIYKINQSTDDISIVDAELFENLYTECTDESYSNNLDSKKCNNCIVPLKKQLDDMTKECDNVKKRLAVTTNDYNQLLSAFTKLNMKFLSCQSELEKYKKENRDKE